MSSNVDDVPADPRPKQQSVPYHIDDKDLMCLNANEHIYSKSYYSGLSFKKFKESGEIVDGVMQAKLTNGLPTLIKQKEFWMPRDSMQNIIDECVRHGVLWPNRT